MKRGKHFGAINFFEAGLFSEAIPDMIISGNEGIHFPLPQGRVGRAHHGDHDERRDADRLRHHPQNPRRKAPGGHGRIMGVGVGA